MVRVRVRVRVRVGGTFRNQWPCCAYLVGVRVRVRVRVRVGGWSDWAAGGLAHEENVDCEQVRSVIVLKKHLVRVRVRVRVRVSVRVRVRVLKKHMKANEIW